MLSAVIAACGGDEGAPGGGNPNGSNTAPTIGGSPPTTVAVDSAYSFVPSAQDADGDSLTFSATGLPSWLELDSGSGELSGTPSQADVGTYSDLFVTVSDGAASARFGPFSISVVAVGARTATLNWVPPVANTDGSQLVDLAGYKIYWGTSPGDYAESVMVDNPGITTYVIDGLTPGTWYFTATAVNSLGIESAFSNASSKTVQ